MARVTLLNLNPDEYNQGLRYYQFMVNLDRFNGCFNTLNNPFKRICVPNKTEDVNLSIFNMITKINKSKTLTRHISCICKSKFDGRKCNSNQKWKNDKCQCECKNKKNVCKKVIFGILVLILLKTINI